MGLKAGELLVYLYLHYQKGVRRSQCWPSYVTIGKAVGISRKTVQRHVHSLIDEGLIQADDTMIRRRDGRSYNGSLLYTVKSIEQILKEREEEFLAELKLAKAQRKWDRRSQKRDRPCSVLYENSIYRHIIPVLGKIRLSKLITNDLQQFYTKMKKSGRLIRMNIYGEGLSDRMVRACHTRCLTALDRAVADDLIRVSPAADCKLPGQALKDMNLLTREEMQRFLIQAKEEGY